MGVLATLRIKQIIQSDLALDHLRIFALGNALGGYHCEPGRMPKARFLDKGVLALINLFVFILPIYFTSQMLTILSARSMMISICAAGMVVLLRQE